MTIVNADRAPYSPIVSRPKLTWPDGKRLALWVVPNIEHYEYLPLAQRARNPWPRTPHPELAELYVETGRDSGVDHYKRISKLVDLAPDARESHLAAVRAALDSNLTGEARRHLLALEDETVTTCVARLWAELEEREENADEASLWLRRVADADPEATWQCDRCGEVASDWHAVCEVCGAFDHAVWRPPGPVDPLLQPQLPATSL